MIAWILNISIISILVILILHYAFEYFGHPTTTNGNQSMLQIQKYKSIIEKMTQDTSAAAFKAAYEEESGIVSDFDNLEEELELYIHSNNKAI